MEFEKSNSSKTRGNFIYSSNQKYDNSLQEDDNRILLIYPRGRGGISISANDFYSLGTDKYLNDVILDFYLKYLHLEVLSEMQRVKTHIFCPLFYKLLTSVTEEEEDQKFLNDAQKQHQRVQSWTTDVNLFEKEFIIVPINESSHWFLAIICFSNLTEPHTMDTNQPIKLIPNQKKGINSEDEEIVDKGQPVKVPCILIFDSLGKNHLDVFATLRDYLTCEYEAKFPNGSRQYTKTNMVGSVVEVPQQQNLTDCGLFLLQYVEHFFKHPIQDFRIPIKSLANWFHQDIVTRKRENISNLIQELMKREGYTNVEAPKVEYPTKDGVILEPPSSNDTFGFPMASSTQIFEEAVPKKLLKPLSIKEILVKVFSTVRASQQHQNNII